MTVIEQVPAFIAVTTVPFRLQYFFDVVLSAKAVVEPFGTDNLLKLSSVLVVVFALMETVFV